MNFEKELDLAKRLATKSGDYLWDVFMNNLKINYEHKSKHEIVTKYDDEIEKIIIKGIHDQFPDHQYLGEEDGYGDNNNSDYLWIIDPIDGTTNFAVKNPLFGVSIALAYKGVIVLGVIYIPFSKELFWAEKDGGAYINKDKISVSKTDNLGSAFITYCHGYKDVNVKRMLKAYSHFKVESFEARQLGSAVVEFMWVACGRTDTIFIPGTNAWDVASGAIIVNEAGGRVTDFNNNDWDIKSPDILASNGLIHDNILKVLRSV